MKKILFVSLVLALCICLSGCGKTEGVKKAEEAFKKIGDVTIDSKAAIEEAEKVINTLTDEEKEKYKMQEKIDSIKKDYERVVEEEKVKEVIKKIDSIGEVTLADGAQIDGVDAEFKNISAEYQSKVSNKSKLDAAKKSLEELRKAEKERIIGEKSPLFNQSYDKVEGITWYEHKNTPGYIDIRSYIIPYIGQVGNNTWMCIRYNYTADSWIFWENMTIMVDGVKYYKYVGRSNTIRDNDTEVWEYYDESLDYNLGMDNKDLKMLKAISESKETIIRFQGDEYNYDLNVTPTDKQIIADTLAMYEALTW